MSFFGGGSTKVIPEFTGLQVNTSVQVLPIPIIYGAPRVQLNLIYYNGFNVQQVSTSGKGIMSGGKGAGQTEYFATFLGAIGEGPIGPVLMIFQDQNVWTPATYPTNGASYFSGSAGQAPWPYIVALWPKDARPYKNTAYYAFANAQIDASATVPQINLVLKGFLSGTSPLNDSTIVITTGQYDQNGNPMSYIGPIHLGTVDADPGAVILDFLTNTRYGATFPLQWVDQLTLLSSNQAFDPNIGDQAISTYCQAVGFAWSEVVNNAEVANSVIDRWCKNIGVAPVWNGALLRFIPYWDTYANRNPHWSATNGIAKKYFNPFTIPITQITLDHMLQSEGKDEHPVSFARKDPTEVYNTVRVDFRDRNNWFNDNTAETKDEAHIELFGPRIDNIGSAREFSLMTYANTAANVLLRRNIAVVLTYTWKMGPLWAWLDPMDIVQIPDPANTGAYVTVRIISVEDDDNEEVTITAEEFPLGAQAPTIVDETETTPPNQGALNVPSSNAYPPVVFEPTSAMLTATGFAVPQFVFGASGGNGPGYAGMLDPNWGGCFIWVSLDGVNYQQVGELVGPSTIGSLSASLPGAVGSGTLDSTSILQVNLNECNGTLASVSSSAALAGHSICCIQDASGFEILAYTNAILIAPYTYQLTGLYRGMYGTTARMFGSGSQFLYVGSLANIFETALPPGYVGQTFWLKPQSFNSMRNYVQELDTVTAYQYIVGGTTPVAPTAPPPLVPKSIQRGGQKWDFVKPPRAKAIQLAPLPLIPPPDLSWSLLASAGLPAGYTFTRTGTATYFDSTGTLQSAATNTPRFDYDPVSLSPKGLLMETQIANPLRNNTMVGAVAGTPGTMPTNWSWGTLSGLSTQVVGTGTESGIAYIDLRCFGTSSGTTAVLNMETTTGITASTGQTWTESWYAKIIANTNLTSTQMDIRENTSGGATLVDNTSPTILPANVNLNAGRVKFTATLSNASTARVQPILQFNFSSGVSVDFTVRIGLPQIEQGRIASSSILTSGAGIVRNNDTLNWTPGAPFNASQGTFLVEFDYGQGTSAVSQTAIHLWDGTLNNRITAAVANNLNTQVIIGGTLTATLNCSAKATNPAPSGFAGAANPVKIAHSYGPTGHFAAGQGVAASAPSVAVPSGLASFALPGLNFLSGNVRRVSYWQTPFTTDQLQVITR